MRDGIRGQVRLNRSPGPAIVVGAGTIAELGVVRGLASRGYGVSLATWEPSSPAARSRELSGLVEIASPRHDPTALVDQVATAAARFGAVAILPGTESALILLAEKLEALDSNLAIGSPPAEIVRRATDKRSVHAAARGHGLGVIPTLDAGEASPSALGLPAVVKPVRSVHRDGAGRMRQLGVRRAVSERQVREAVDRLPVDALLQPFLQARIRTLNGVAWRGEAVAWVHQEADRIWRPDCGVLCAARTVAPDIELEGRSAALLADLSWSGIFNLQFLEHRGESLLMDLNPRPYHSLALAIGAGANLPGIWADLLLGRRPEIASCRTGVHWHYRRDDLRALVATARAGRVASAAGGLVRRPNTVSAAFSIRDPAPAISVLKQDIGRIARRVRPGVSTADGDG